MSFQPIYLTTLDFNPFQRIGRDWMLITAGDDAGVNTMTASWGGAGTLWGEDVVTVYIRPSRYTHQFVEAQGRFSLCFFDEAWRAQLSMLGRVSGRDRDKIADAGLHVTWLDGIPVFEQARQVLLVQTLYVDTLRADCFTDRALLDKCYPQRDLHTVYVGKVLGAYEQ